MTEVGMRFTFHVKPVQAATMRNGMVRDAGWVIREENNGVYLAQPSDIAQQTAPWCLFTMVRASTLETNLPPQAVWESEQAALDFVSTVLGELNGR
jgi:hypothetical protein